VGRSPRRRLELDASSRIFAASPVRGIKTGAARQNFAYFVQSNPAQLRPSGRDRFPGKVRGSLIVQSIAA
jgi:hypothetical protein